MSPDIVKALLNEFIFTFALCFVVLNVATSSKSAGNSILRIGSRFYAGGRSIAGARTSGAVYNPAVAVGITTMGLSTASNIWIFLVGNFVGGAVAATVYKFVNPDEFKK